MVSKRDGFLVIWPQYFDSSLSRKHGRRVSKGYSVPSPKAVEIALMCSYVKLTPRLDERAIHPNVPWDTCMRVLVRKPTAKGKKISKQRLIRILGKRLKKWHEGTPKKARNQEINKLLERIEKLK